MEAIPTCPECQGWDLAQSDSFCSWCGVELGIVCFESDTIPFFWNDTETQIERMIEIHNRSAFDTQIVVDSAPAWLAFPEGNGLSVVSKGEASLRIIADMKEFSVVPGPQGEFVLRSLAQDTQFSFKVIVENRPKVEAVPLRLRRGCRETLSLRLLSWQHLIIKEAKFEPDWLSLESKPVTQRLELNGESLELPVQSNVPARASVGKRELKCRLTISGLNDPLEVSVPVVITAPPVLRIRERSNFRPVIVPGAIDSFQLTMSNEGKEDLVVSKISAVQLEGSDGPHLKAKSTSLPMKIEPGKKGSLEFKVSLPKVPQEGEWRFQLEFQSNDPNPNRGLRTLPLKVENRVFKDYLAVDFGTTSSAVAVVNKQNARPENKVLSEAEEVTIDSNIWFKQYDEERTHPWVWVIGKEATEGGAVDRDRFVRSVKTSVGKNESKEIVFVSQTRELGLDEMAIFIISDLLRRAQRDLKRRCSKFILCVPTRFTLRRKEVLEDVFRRAARLAGTQCEELEVVDESLAAGLYYVVDRGPTDPKIKRKKDYTLMIMDFGGGTTDVTVLHVFPKTKGQDTVYRVRIIGSWGDQDLGGERITEDIAEILTERFLEKRSGRKPGPREIEEEKASQQDEAEAAKIVFSELGRLKQEGIEDAATLLKRARSSFVEKLSYVTVGKGPVAPNNRLLEALEKYRQEKSIEVWSDDFAQHGRVPLAENEVSDIYQKRLSRLKSELKMLLKKIDVDKVDILLLAGQSSQYPSVRQTLAELADKSEFVRQDSNELILKECVSLGAAIYSRVIKGTFRLKLEGTRRYWARLGLREGARQDFREYLPWGAEYPFESSEIELKPEWVRSGRLRWEVLENLSLYDEGRSANAKDPRCEARTEEFATFAIDVRPSPQGYKGKIVITEKGKIEAFCKVGKTWKPMERE